MRNIFQGNMDAAKQESLKLVAKYDILQTISEKTKAVNVCRATKADRLQISYQ